MRSLYALLACALLVGCAGAPTGAANSTAAPSTPSPAPSPSDSAGSASTADPEAATIRLTNTSVPTSAWPAGTLLHSRYPGRLVEGEQPLVIYLPPGYDRTADPLPAVYLLHGIGYDEQQWVELGLHQQLEQHLSRGEWQPLILVMPLMPDPLFSSTDGGPDSYEAEFLNGLIPYVERNFRADPQRRALAGISRGGVWALEIALQHPDEFAGVAALSPALHMNFPRPRYDPSVIATEAIRFPPVIYLAAGDGEPRTLTAVLEFSALLVELGVEHTLQLGEGGHDQEYWRQAAPAALAALAAGLAR